MRNETFLSSAIFQTFSKLFQQNAVQLGPHAGEIPAEMLAILHPFKVTGGHAAGVGQDIGKHGKFPLFEDFVGLDRGRIVGRFHNVLGPDFAGIVLR